MTRHEGEEEAGEEVREADAPSPEADAPCEGETQAAVPCGDCCREKRGRS